MPFKSALVALLVIATGSAVAQDRETIDLTGPGWKLWHDAQAAWKDDLVLLPPVDLATLPINPPTGGWATLESNAAKAVSVPGTVEEYLQTVPGPDGDLTGVSWWYRTITIPASSAPRSVHLHFEAVRMRAEVFINQQLVGYDLIGNTPFDVDLSKAAKPGDTVQLAVRITDPGGVFDWKDGWILPWGTLKVPSSHGFGGISGRVKLIVSDQVHIDDVAVQNTPAITTVNVTAQIANHTTVAVERDVTLSIVERSTKTEVFRTTQPKAHLLPGTSRVLMKAAVPQAKVWNLDDPNLYRCVVTLTDGEVADHDERVFGFRWFAPVGIGADAMFMLNGKRIVLRSAISWGFWPITGLYATPELAEKQVRLAKSLGLNMLNAHRCIGDPLVFEKADELGLLMYEEPGDYSAGYKDPFAKRCISEKFRRMVLRDRNHPSLVIYSQGNEMRDVSAEHFANDQANMREAHALDPSRTITRTSGWAPLNVGDDQAKLHMRPFDDTLYLQGWYDYHHAPGPAVWLQSFYQDPTHFYNHTDNASDIIFWGEEGALSTPSRLELIKQELDHAPRLGWDSKMYLDLYKDFDRFLSAKNLRSVFPTVDALTTAMGNISFEHQGRKIEISRIDNRTDGYVINGWEAEIIENHSGIVDCFRNPKGDPAILAHYNQPQYVAVKVRHQIVQVPGEVTVDFYAINELNLHGAHTLHVTVTTPSGQEIAARDLPVTLTGGTVYGQTLCTDVALKLPQLSGYFTIRASLRDMNGNEVATGQDRILGVDWASTPITGNGAVWEYGHALTKFLKDGKGIDVLTYDDALPKLDWLVIARSPNGGDRMIINSENLRDVSGQQNGVTTSFFMGTSFDSQPVVQRLQPTINMVVPTGANPDPLVPATEKYSVRWEGSLIPPYTGDYTFDLQTAGKTTVMLDGKVIAFQKDVGSAKIALEAGKPVSLKVEMIHARHNASCRLFWTIPDPQHHDAQRILDRVKQDGTSLVILENAVDWMKPIAANTAITYAGSFAVGTNWLGGVHFVRAHPLFRDLPVDGGMDWPYQAVVGNGNERFGLLMSGEELVAGAYHCYPNQLGTAVGIIPCGKGRIIFSTLDIAGQIQSPSSDAQVARKLLCNFIANGGKP